MNQDRIEKLKEIIAPDEHAELTVLCDAYGNTLNAYQADEQKSADKLKANRAAKAALVELVENLENRYLTGAKQFRSGMQALRYLQKNGWKIEKSKLYEDRNRGLIKFNTDKSVDEAAVLAYAAKYLDKVKSTGAGDEAGVLAEKKLSEEIDYRQLQKEKLKFEIAREKGQYIHRSKWLTELVLKLSASKFIVLQVARDKAPDLIAASGGDLKKEAVFVKLFSDYIENAFNELVVVPELQFIIQTEE